MTTQQSQSSGRFTVQEYLRREFEAEEKHDYRDGEIISMAGGSPPHSLIIANTIRALGNLLSGEKCRVYDSNLRVRVMRDARYSYPDASVICGDPEYDPADQNKTTITNPRAVFEVLSPSTESTDRGEKFGRYLKLASLQEYVLISQDRPRVEMYYRQPDGTWLFAYADGRDATARLRSLNIDLPLSDLYSGAEFPSSPKPSDTTP